MSRKIFAMLAVVALLVMTIGGRAGTTQAQSVSAMSNSVFLPMIGASPATPSVDGLAVPDAVKAAVALRASLSADQLASIKAMVERYNSRVKEAGQGLQDPAGQEANAAPKPSSDKASTPQAAASLAAASSIQAAKAVQAQMEAINSDMDKEFASILNADQLKLFQASKPVNNSSKATAAQGPLGTAGSPDSSVQASTSCYYAGQYAANATYYLYWAYYYAYYNYYYYGTTYGYYAYLYSYYAYYSYAVDALAELGGAYFSILQLGSDFSGLGSAGVSDAYYAYYYGYYGSLYGSYDYSYGSGSIYAYYAYLYGYYGYSAAYNAYYYGYYYCQ